MIEKFIHFDVYELSSATTQLRKTINSPDSLIHGV